MAARCYPISLRDVISLDFSILAFIMHNMANIGLVRDITTIGVLPINGFALMSYASIVEPFRAANLLSQRPIYNVINFGKDLAHVSSSGAAKVTPDGTIGESIALDYLFVVAGGSPETFNDGAIFSWLRRLARQGTLLGGVSGGPVILARAGLMDGYRMTVHWEHAEALAEVSPNLIIERSLYVIDRGRVTCAGGTAPMDMAHALIANEHGNLFARRVSDWFLHTDIRPSIGAQRGGMVERIGTTNAAILDAIKAMESHVADPLTLGHLAASAGVSVRQLNRLFQEKLGDSTMGYYRQMRLEKARGLLRNSPMSLTEIALATGFASSSHFSKAHSQQYGHAPSSLR